MIFCKDSFFSTARFLDLFEERMLVKVELMFFFLESAFVPFLNLNLFFFSFKACLATISLSVTFRVVSPKIPDLRLNRNNNL